MTGCYMYVAPSSNKCQSSNECSQKDVSLQGRVECEGPNNRLYDFVGNITFQSQK